VLVRDDVTEETAGRKEPYTYGSLPGNEDLFLRLEIAPRVWLVLAEGTDVSFWHETVMPVPSPQVRYEGMSGPSSVAVRGPSLTRSGLRLSPIRSLVWVLGIAIW